MNRREFLRRTATAAAIAAVVPSALLAAAKPALRPIKTQGTNFAALTEKQKLLWGRNLWDEQRSLALGPERLELLKCNPIFDGSSIDIEGMTIIQHQQQIAIDQHRKPRRT